MNPRDFDPIIQLALNEDLCLGDITSEAVFTEDHQSQACFKMRESGIIAGLDLAQRVFALVDPKLEFKAETSDSSFMNQGECLAKIQGSTLGILKAERVALNFLQRLCGIATLTARFVNEAKKGNPQVKVLDTRKTTPGMRRLEKYAVVQGGGHNHRFSLGDGVMLKDNHLAALKKTGLSLSQAVDSIKAKIPHTIKIEIEIDRPDQMNEAIEAGADILLLDNMSLEQIKQSVSINQGRVLLEASGGVDLSSIANIAALGVDFISIGRLTHSAPALDIGLDYDSL